MSKIKGWVYSCVPAVKPIYVYLLSSAIKANWFTSNVVKKYWLQKIAQVSWCVTLFIQDSYLSVWQQCAHSSDNNMLTWVWLRDKVWIDCLHSLNFFLHACFSINAFALFLSCRVSLRSGVPLVPVLSAGHSSALIPHTLWIGARNFQLWWDAAVCSSVCLAVPPWAQNVRRGVADAVLVVCFKPSGFTWD